MSAPRIVLLGLALALNACASAPVAVQSGSTADVVLTSVHIVDVRRGVILRDQSVVIRGNRIVQQGPVTAIQIPRSARIMDGRGGYLLPGLWDMHVHLRGRFRPTEVDLPLNLANGVTGVRDMSSDCYGDIDREAGCVEDLRVLAAEIDSGRVLGPRLVGLSSWGVDGVLPPEAGPEFFSARSELEGRQLARHFASRKVDFVKVLSRVSRAGYLGLMDEARRLGLPVVGHEPLAVTAIELSNTGQRSVEHARVFLSNCFPAAATYRAEARSATPPTTWMRRMADEYDPALCQDVFSAFQRNGTWYTPTHVTRRVDAHAEAPAFRADERLKYVTPEALVEWKGDLDRTVARDPSPAGLQARMDYYLKGLTITGAAYQSGVRVLLGTDAGDSYIFPGFSIHDELEELVKAGLTPAQALRAGTADAAEFVGRTRDFGTIEEGKIADLLLLDANPLEQVSNTRRIRAVVFDGRWLDRDALDAMLARASTVVAGTQNARP